MHLGTGNYNPGTARLYTDFSLFTCDEQIGNDAVTLFNRLTGYSEEAHYSALLVAPEYMRPEMVSCIQREIANARRGEPAKIVAKMNALDDPEMIGGSIKLHEQACKSNCWCGASVRFAPGSQG